jgi:SAM-dependent methyltransferase
MPAFADHFAFAARSYASYRPRYPAALFDWIASFTPVRARVWDCGTGSGQAAVALAPRYGEVIATDPSVAQLASAERAVGVTYMAMTAEHGALAAGSMDLVTVAQALHWFDVRAFFAETDRVLRPGGVLAVWSYGLLSIDPVIDVLMQRLYRDTLGPYWPSERALVDSGYAGIAFPYPEVTSPELAMEATWTLVQLGGFLSTWSAVGRYRMTLGSDPLPAFMSDVAAAWGTSESRQVRWPLVARLAQKDPDEAGQLPRRGVPSRLSRDLDL